MFQELTLVKRIKKRIPKVESTAEDNQQLDAEEKDEESEGSVHPALEGVGNDDFTQSVAKAFQWLIFHKWPIIIGCAALLIAILVVNQMQIARDKARVEATNVVLSAVKDYKKALLPEGEDAAAKATARQAALETAKASFAKAEADTKEMTVSSLAMLGSAGVAFDLGDYDGAIAKYDALLARNGLDPLARGVALQGKATALDAKGDLDQASTTWRALKDLDAHAFGLISDVQVARLLERQAKQKDARIQYEQIQKDYAKELSAGMYIALKADIAKHLAQLPPVETQGEAH